MRVLPQLFEIRVTKWIAVNLLHGYYGMAITFI